MVSNTLSNMSDGLYLTVFGFRYEDWTCEELL